MYTPTDAEKKAVKGRGFLANSQGGGFSARIITVNGDVRYKVRQVYATRLLENLDALLNGGEIKTDF